MRPSPTRDLVVGVFVLIGLSAVAFLSFRVAGDTYRGPTGFRLVATFNEVGGLKPRSPVVISGVKVGTVERIDLDDQMRARATLNIDPRLKLPVDTSAAIRTSGVLGDQYVALTPGAEEQLLESGDPIQYTESAISVEKLISKFVTGFSDKDSTKGDAKGKESQ